MVWGLVSLSALTQGSVWNTSPLQMGTQTKVPCAQAEDSGLLGLLHSPISKLGQGVHRFLSSSLHCTESGEVSWSLCRLPLKHQDSHDKTNHFGVSL